MKTISTITAALMLAAATILPLAPPAFAQTKTNAQTQIALTKEDEQGIRKTINGFVAAWNTSDMKAMDKLFCEDAEFVNVVGMHWRGRAQIDAAHIVFDKLMFHGVQMKVDSIGVRPLSSDYAIAVVLETLDSYTTPSGQVVPKGQVRGSWVLARNGGDWKIAHCQNVNVDAEAAKHDPVNSRTGVSPQSRQNTLQRDLRQLQGDWMIDSETSDGQQQPDEIKRVTMTYTGHHWIQRKDGVITSEGSSEFRPDTNPKQIDISPLGGPAAGKVVPGIYRLSGDTYESCFVLPGKERPTEFSSKQGSGHFYVIFKRAHK